MGNRDRFQDKCYAILKILVGKILAIANDSRSSTKDSFISGFAEYADGGRLIG